MAKNVKRVERPDGLTIRKSRQPITGQAPTRNPQGKRKGLCFAVGRSHKKVREIISIAVCY